MSHRFTFFTLHVPFLVGLVCSVCLCFVVLVVFGSLFCMCGRLSFDYSCGCIQMTDHASTLCKKKKS